MKHFQRSLLNKRNQRIVSSAACIAIIALLCLVNISSSHHGRLSVEASFTDASANNLAIVPASGGSTQCTFNGTNYNPTAVIYTYPSSTVTYPSTCSATVSSTCQADGTWSPATGYAGCSQTWSNCTFNGTTVAGNGGTVTAYQTSSVAYGSTCTSQTRTCSNGTLSGTYLYSSCYVQSRPAASCSLSVSPTTINQSQSSTLTWGSANSDAFYISNISYVTPNATSSTSVSPLVTTEYDGYVTQTHVYLTSGTSWTVPSDWSNTGNAIEVIGGGGGGAGSVASTRSGSGGGGGAYSKVTNVTLTPGATIAYSVGSGAAGGPTNGSRAASGGDTYFCNSSSNCAAISGTAVIVGAKGGQGAGSAAPGAGGAAASGVGTTKYSGGAGGIDSGNGGSGGGGGAGGPTGTGGAGGVGGNVLAGAGGGGGGGGTAGGNSTSNTAFGVGGNGNNNGGGGTTDGASGAASSTYSAGGGAGSYSTTAGNGGAGKEWDDTHGSGGGGGGGGDTVGVSHAGGAGGLYGGGGGGSAQYGGSVWVGGAGAQGIIVISYVSTSTAPACSATLAVNASCTFNGQTIISGMSTTSYAAATVPYGSSCQSQTRTCTNGTLSGTYAYGSCSVLPANNCTLDGVTVNDGTSRTFYSTQTATGGAVCSSYSQSRTCSNGTLSGSGTYQYANCSCAAAYSCSGSNVTYTDTSCNTSTVATCSSPGYCTAGVSSCQYPPISENPNAGNNTSGHLQIRPSIIRAGNSTTLYWNVSNAQSCTASGGGYNWTGLTGQHTTGAITQTTTFSLNCTAYGGNPNLSESAQVIVQPNFQEN